MRDRPVRLDHVDLLALAGLCALAVLLTWRLSLAGQILQGPDAFAYFYPLYGHAADRLLDGQLPLWNAYLFLGAPFLANPQAGVFYPVHWLLASLPAPSLVAATVVLHYALAATGMYLLLRLGLGRGRHGAVAGALVFALSGHLGAQAEHVNQVEALAWLPWQVLLLEMGAVRAGSRWERRGLLVLGAGVISGLQLLIGHAQAVYICHTVLLVYGATRPLWGDGGREELWPVWRRSLLFIGTAALLGVGLAAVQLGPTLELVGLSLRAGGLDYRQAASFSFGPRSWLLGILPHYGAEAPFSEYVAYVGVVGLALAILGARHSGRSGRWMLVLVAVGGFLALGIYNPLYYVLFRIVPGFGLFRVPARWLVLAVLGLSLLAAAGVDRLERVIGRRPTRREALIVPAAAVGLVLLWVASDPRPEPVTLLGWVLTGVLTLLVLRARPGLRRSALVALLSVELAFASGGLPYSQTIAPQIYEAQRRSTQVLLSEGGLGRFLTVSEPVFDSGDMADLAAALGEVLTEEGRYGLLVGAKWQEVLSRNLALSWGLYAVDGYDGGVLPTSDFLAFQELLVGADRVAADGRLSEALRELPDKRYLALAGVEYLLSDRVHDAWIDDAYYDLSLALAAPSGGGDTALAVPPFLADAIGMVVEEGDPEQITDGTVVRLSLGDGRTLEVSRDQGSLWAEDAAGERTALEAVPDREGLRHAAIILSPEPIRLESLVVHLPAETGDRVQGLSLINRRNGTATALELDPSMTTLNLGDVRLRRFEETLPRAYFSSCAIHAGDRQGVLARLSQPDFDPRLSLVLAGDAPDRCPQEGWRPVSIVSYEPERVVLAVEAAGDGHVVLLDSYYPGWEARVDGDQVDIERANWFFRAVPVSAGTHEVEFNYAPRALAVGARVTLGTILVLGLGVLLCLSRSRRRSNGASTGEPGAVYTGDQARGGRT